MGTGGGILIHKQRLQLLLSLEELCVLQKAHWLLHHTEKLEIQSALLHPGSLAEGF